MKGAADDRFVTPGPGHAVTTLLGFACMYESCVGGPNGGYGPSMTLTGPSPTAPWIGTVVVDGAIDAANAARLDAELAGRIAVGTQVLMVDVGRADFVGPAGLGVLAGAATRLQDERSGSLVLRNADANLLRQLRMLRLDHVFELEV